MSKFTTRIDRRRFLEITSSATAALLTACEAEVSSTPGPGPGGSNGAGGAAPDGSAPVGVGGAGGATTGGSAGTGGSGGAAPDGSTPGTGGGGRDTRDGSTADANDARVQDAGPPPPLTEADWQALASSLSGTVIRPGNALYNQARVLFNTRWDSIMPQAVVRAANPSDVAKVLAFVQKFGLAVTPRCGGHDFAGYSTTTGVVIDVGPMSTIQVGNDGTATIGAGAKLADVYDQLIARNVGVPLGTCLSVGISGLTQGGGIGVIDRMYGLTCDALVSAQVVVADGRILTCDATNEPDLFWAIRGGGGGNFGVVTSFTFKTHATQNLTNFSADIAFSDLAKVLTAWQTWQAGLPDNIWSFLITTFLGGGGPNVTLQGVSLGTPAEFMTYWNNFTAAAGVQPQPNITTKSYRDTMMAFCANRTISQCHLVGQTPDAQIQRATFASTSDLYDAALPAQGVQTFVQAIQNAVSQGIRGQILLDAMGGALGRVAPDATAFPHRRSLFSAEYYQDAGGVASPTWANSMRTTMRAYTSGRAYVNYRDPLITDTSVYYGANYARLGRVKTKYDPNQVFRFAQSIPPM
jgi:FAD/FMN-containing dehydrogenase